MVTASFGGEPEPPRGCSSGSDAAGEDGWRETPEEGTERARHAQEILSSPEVDPYLLVAVLQQAVRLGRIGEMGQAALGNPAIDVLGLADPSLAFLVLTARRLLGA
jgi:hypothetical protein